LSCLIYNFKVKIDIKMGGSDPLFEESKVAGDALDMVDRMHSMFITHPVYTCAAIGTFFLSILIYVFMQR
jgi:hypothetical protein